MIELKGVTKQYLYGESVLDGLDMIINDGEIIAVLGEEGAGKTTLLKVIAGVTDFEGKIFLDKKSVSVKNDAIIMQFDDLAIFKHKNVYNNLAYPLKIRKKSKEEIDKAVKESADLFNLTACLYNNAGRLSLIDKKRLAIARLFLRDAKLLVLDSPTSDLTYKEKNELWKELVPLLIKKKKQGVSIVFSTDDKDEAISIADRIVCMQTRKVKQIGTYEQIYNQPQSVWAAEKIDEYYNFEVAKLISKNEKLMLLIDRKNYQLKLDANLFKNKIVDTYIGKEILIGSHCESFLDKGECDKVEYYIKKHDGYVLFTQNDLKVFSKNICDEVCTIYNLEKCKLFDKSNENSIMKN